MLIIFDCDGVLVDSELLAAEAMANLLRAHGLNVHAASLLQFVGMKQADILAGVEALAGKPVPAAVPAGLWEETKRLFAERLEPVPGVEAFIRTHAQRRCVASSSHHARIRFSLEKTGLYPLFAPHVFSSTEVARGKPAPDLFLHAAAQMGEAPKACTVIEDSLAGVTGAKAAGMRVIGFTGGAHSGPHFAQALKDAGADAIAGNYQEVAGLL